VTSTSYRHGRCVQLRSLTARRRAELPNPLNAEDTKILAGECVITGNGLTGVVDAGTATPIPSHVPPPHQTKGKRPRPIRR
jgi:hypothetical protein